MIISERIYQILKEQGMTQLEFSKKTGIAQSTISDWKRKKTNPASDKLMVICEVLGVTPYDLLVGTDAGRETTYRDSDFVLVHMQSEEYTLMETFKKLDDEAKARLMAYAQELSAK